jgi:hypothetical protein
MIPVGTPSTVARVATAYRGTSTLSRKGRDTVSGSYRNARPAVAVSDKVRGQLSSSHFLSSMRCDGDWQDDYGDADDLDTQANGESGQHLHEEKCVDSEDIPRADSDPDHATREAKEFPTDPRRASWSSSTAAVFRSRPTNELASQIATQLRARLPGGTMGRRALRHCYRQGCPSVVLCEGRRRLARRQWERPWALRLPAASGDTNKHRRWQSLCRFRFAVRSGLPSGNKALAGAQQVLWYDLRRFQRCFRAFLCHRASHIGWRERQRPNWHFHSAMLRARRSGRSLSISSGTSGSFKCLS